MTPETIILVLFSSAMLLLTLPPIYKELKSIFIYNRVRVGNQVSADEFDDDINYPDEYSYKPLDN